MLRNPLPDGVDNGAWELERLLHARRIRHAQHELGPLVAVARGSRRGGARHRQENLDGKSGHRSIFDGFGWVLDGFLELFDLRRRRDLCRHGLAAASAPNLSLL